MMEKRRINKISETNVIGLEDITKDQVIKVQENKLQKEENHVSDSNLTLPPYNSITAKPEEIYNIEDIINNQEIEILKRFTIFKLFRKGKYRD